MWNFWVRGRKVAGKACGRSNTRLFNQQSCISLHEALISDIEQRFAVSNTRHDHLWGKEMRSKQQGKIAPHVTEKPKPKPKARLSYS